MKKLILFLIIPMSLLSGSWQQPKRDTTMAKAVKQAFEGIDRIDKNVARIDRKTDTLASIIPMMYLRLRELRVSKDSADRANAVQIAQILTLAKDYQKAFNDERKRREESEEMQRSLLQGIKTGINIAFGTFIASILALLALRAYLRYKQNLRLSKA